MGGRFGRVLIVALALVGSVAAAACGDDGAQVTASDLEVREVGVEGGEDGFDLGRSTATGRVPLLGRDGDRIAVQVVDVGAGTAADHGSPIESPVGDASVAMSERWIVVTTTACSGGVVEGDAGTECDGSGRPVVLASPADGAPAWTEVDLGVPLDAEDGVPWIVSVEGDRAVLRLPTRDAAVARPQVAVDLAAGTASAIEPYDPGAPRCSLGDEPDLLFPTPDGPTSFLLPGADSPVALPEAVSPLPNLFCWASGTWLLSGTTLVDLDHPDAAPIELPGSGDPGAEVLWFGAAGSAWAASVGERIVVQPGAGAARTTVEAPPDRNEVVVADGLVLATRGDGGDLTRVWAVPFA